MRKILVLLLAEVPACAAATNAAGGLFIVHVVDEASGTVEFKFVANNLAGSSVAARIHVAPKGVAGPVVQNLGVDPGAEDGVVRARTFTNPALLAAIGANPDNYYINVHTGVCPEGVVRGQLGEQGRRRARGSGTTEGTGAPAAWLPSAANHSVCRRRRSLEAKGGTR